LLQDEPIVQQNIPNNSVLVDLMPQQCAPKNLPIFSSVIWLSDVLQSGNALHHSSQAAQRVDNPTFLFAKSTRIILSESKSTTHLDKVIYRDIINTNTGYKVKY
jgi:hypothetical protein